MEKKTTIRRELDAAIDRMDMEAIDKGLEALSEIDPLPIQPEDALLFSARIQKQNEERGQEKMKKTTRPIKYAVVAAIVLLMGITVYAVRGQNFFTFQQGDRLVTMRTTEDMNEQEARELVAGSDSEPIPEEAIGHADVQEYDFDTVEQAEDTLDMRIILPAALPDMQLDSATGHDTHYGESVRRATCWLNYSDGQDRLFGITVSREVVAPGVPVTGYTASGMDEGSLGSYTSAGGIEYTTLTESDDTGERTAHIAVTMIGEYEYALVFFGFEEAERLAIIDSTDLSAYRA